MFLLQRADVLAHACALAYRPDVAEFAYFRTATITPIAAGQVGGIVASTRREVVVALRGDAPPADAPDAWAERLHRWADARAATGRPNSRGQAHRLFGA
ncbi:MAG: hypothetical protein ACOC46_02545, partial [Pirellulales bacterium]